LLSKFQTHNLHRYIKAVASRFPELMDLLASHGVKLPGGAGSHAGSEVSMGGGGDMGGSRTVQFQ
jgi:hypothetical protein